MTDLELDRGMADLIAIDRPLREVVESLRIMRDLGLTRDKAHTILAKLRERAPNEAAEDRILEVMDFASGFCSPHMTIWD